MMEKDLALAVKKRRESLAVKKLPVSVLAMVYWDKEHKQWEWVFDDEDSKGTKSGSLRSKKEQRSNSVADAVLIFGHYGYRVTCMTHMFSGAGRTEFSLTSTRYLFILEKVLENRPKKKTIKKSVSNKDT